MDALDLQRERFKAMTPAQRWKAAHRLYWSARRLKAAYIKHLHPGWDDARVQDAVRLAFTGYARD